MSGLPRATGSLLSRSTGNAVAGNSKELVSSFKNKITNLLLV
jgi:hypothetical protein